MISLFPAQMRNQLRDERVRQQVSKISPLLLLQTIAGCGLGVEAKGLPSISSLNGTYLCHHRAVRGNYMEKQSRLCVSCRQGTQRGKEEDLNMSASCPKFSIQIPNSLPMDKKVKWAEKGRSVKHGARANEVLPFPKQYTAVSVKANSCCSGYIKHLFPK